MWFLVPSASVALIAAAALSAPAAVPTAGGRWAQAESPGPAVPGAAAATGRAAAVGAATAMTALAGADAAAAHAARVPPRGGFAWPLSPRPAVLRRFEQPRNQWSHGHRGIDLLAVVGQPVLSAGEGVVAFSGVIAGRGVIGVRHSGGLRTTYDSVDERLASGAVVHRGDRIGVVSPAPGHCAPHTCLHWGVISEQTYRDPLSLLGFGPPILLPLG